MRPEAWIGTPLWSLKPAWSGKENLLAAQRPWWTRSTCSSHSKWGCFSFSFEVRPKKRPCTAEIQQVAKCVSAAVCCSDRTRHLSQRIMASVLVTACHSAANLILDQQLWAPSARMGSTEGRATYDKKSKLTESNPPAHHTHTSQSWCRTSSALNYSK